MSRERMPWFHCYPSKLLGALAALNSDQQLVYLTILLRIYEIRGPCHDTSDAIARRTGLSRRRVELALNDLTCDGKLRILDDGGLMNDFASAELAHGNAIAESLKRNGSAGGKKSQEIRKSKQQIDEAGLEQGSTDKDSEERKRESSLRSDSSLRSAPIDGQLFEPPTKAKAKSNDWPSDYREQFWALYPRRTEKKSAMAKLDAIRRSGDVPWERFYSGLQRHGAASRGVEERYVKHPTTWLNRGCWDDESVSNGGRDGRTEASRPGGQGVAGNGGYGSWAARAVAKAREASAMEGGFADLLGPDGGPGPEEPDLLPGR